MSDNKLSRFNPDQLPSYFRKLTKEQQNEYLNKLAKDNADLINFAQKNVAKSKTAEHDMAVDLDYFSKLETENKFINVEREYESGSGKMKIEIKGGDRKLIVPVLVVVGILIISILVIMFWN
tara:strand:- start:229 stop:594 length:366 start_codon:yes stop_codon:yes gene_type:complete